MTNDGDAAWNAWIAALGDSRHALRVEIFGRRKMPQPWNMGRRVLPEHMLHLVVHGGHTGQVADRAVRTGPGDVLWVPPRTVQDLRQLPGPFTMYYLRFTLAEAAWPGFQPAVRERLAGAPALFAQLYAEHLGRAKGREARMRALLVELFIGWWRAGSAPETGLEPALLARLESLVDADPGRHWQPAELARRAGLSPTWFARRFRRSTGVAPRQWLLERRLRLAAILLVQDDRPIGAVAERLGYTDQFLFSRQFRAAMGLSPRAWRQRHREA